MASDFPHFYEHIIRTLKDKGFFFLLDIDSAHGELKTQLEHSNERIASILPTALKILGPLYGGDQTVVNTVVPFLSKFLKIGEIEGSNVAALFRDMRERFPLIAIKNSAPGIQYLACLDCDQLSQIQLVAKVDLFTTLAFALKSIIKTDSRILGVRFGKPVESNVYGSICFVFTQKDHCARLTDTVNKLKLNETSFIKELNILKVYVPIWYLINPPEGHVSLDKIVYRLFDNQISNDKRFRTNYFYGCSLSELRIG